jgi:hypothetical protein
MKGGVDMLIKLLTIETIKKGCRTLLVKAGQSKERDKVVQEKIGFDTIDEFMRATSEELKKRGS